MRRRYSDTKPNAAFGPALSQGVYSRSESLIRRDRKVEPFAQTVSVQAQQPSLGVDYRAAGRARQQRGDVLDASGDTAASRPPETPLHTGHETKRHAQPASSRIRQGEDWSADARRGVAPPLDGWQIAGLDPNDGEVSVDVMAQDSTSCSVPIGERDGDLVGPHVVRIGQYLILGDHDARSDAPALSNPDDCVADPLSHALDLLLDSVECSHDASFHS